MVLIYPFLSKWEYGITLAEMGKILPLFLLASISAVSMAAQQASPKTDCPTVIINGPAGVPGDIVTYKAEITGKPNLPALGYKWSVSKGELTSGQGGEIVKVQRPQIDNWTVTLEVVGLPEGCVSTASETAVVCPAPTATKLGEFDGDLSRFSAEQFQTFHQTATDNPNTVIYIMISGSSNDRERSIERKRTILNNRFVSKIGYSPKIAILDSTDDRIWIWLVPAGADLPGPPNNAKVSPDPFCPTVSVMGPAGVTYPGEPMLFSSKIVGSTPPGFKYVWSTNGYDIVGGQDTPTLEVRSRLNENITATLEVVGLPQGCPNTASETAGVFCKCTAKILDEYGPISINRERKRLELAIAAAKKEPDAVIYVLKFFKNKRAENGAALNRVEKYLFQTLKLPFDKFKALMIDDHPVTKTQIFLVPPGADWPTPK